MKGELHALGKAAWEVGGGFYDFPLIEDDWLCFFIGDGSGKGVPAALNLVVTKTLLKASSSKPGAAAEMLAKVTNELCAQTDSAWFVSLFYAMLDLRTDALELGQFHRPARPQIARTDLAMLADDKNHAPCGARCASLPSRP